MKNFQDLQMEFTEASIIKKLDQVWEDLQLMLLWFLMFKIGIM